MPKLRLRSVALGFLALLWPSLSFLASSLAEEGFYAPLKEVLIRQLSPEEIKILCAPPRPREGGLYFERFSLEAKGIRIDGMRIERLVAAALGATFNPEEEWGKVAEIRSADLVALRMEVSEKDINDFFLVKYPPGRKAGWLLIRFDLKEGWVKGEGLYKFSGLPIRTLVELKGKLQVVGGRKVYISDYVMRVDGVEIPSKRAEAVVNKIQPLLDLDKLAFPGRISRVEVREDSLLVETSPSPESLM